MSAAHAGAQEAALRASFTSSPALSVDHSIPLTQWRRLDILQGPHQADKRPNYASAGQRDAQPLTHLI